MAIASILCAAMNNNNNKNHPEAASAAAALDNADEDEQDSSDMVMPGFRFHPTEEELVEFYLRRKVEGKRFNVELITFLDLYRYDPWELPALAAIGEKEWYFYVPRDRKYRNGDRPNRVTTSGYWKATGADRMIRSENLRSIGLKKTLVFYSGKAPKGIRTSWIMNEYRLPLHETERLQKVEISLCRVYKRAGVEDHPCLPRSLPTTRASSSSSSSLSKATQPTPDNNNMVNFQSRYGKSPQQTDGKLDETSPTSTSTDIISRNPSYMTISPLLPMVSSSSSDHELLQSKKNIAAIPINPMTSSSAFHHHHVIMNDDLQKLVNISNTTHSGSNNHIQNPHDQYLGNVVPNLLSHFHTKPPPPESAALNLVPGAFQAPFTDRLWEWNNGAPEGSKDFTNLFK